jgi:hypothetical protein
MGWANCGFDDLGRNIGYAFEAECDESGCKAEIDRGLSYVCGGMHGGGDHGCGRYFCSEHLVYHDPPPTMLCPECSALYPDTETPEESRYCPD